MSVIAGVRPVVQGKFIFVGNEKLYIRGVTYGTFRLDEDGNEHHDPEVVERDFAQMAANGLNAIRTYTVPPRWLLDAAQRHNLRVMMGIPWEQHVAFLDNKKRVRSIEERVGNGVCACAGHPAVLCYAIGNEIPASVVRWYGHQRVERFLERLYRIAKAADPEGLVTYVNYPTTEYLQLPFLDLVCFNVYLEAPESLEAYLARLQNIAGDRPLIMAEIGLDSRRHGEDAQAQALDWQIRTAFAAGCAGAFVFAWTDEWYRGAMPSKTGISASRIVIGSQSQRWAPCATHLPKCPSRQTCPGLVSRWWSAVITEPVPLVNALRDCCTWSIRTSK
jgi:beta-galactosidase/beta-glucuronidase